MQRFAKIPTFVVRSNWRMAAALAVAAAALSIVATEISAAMYKWTDANGRVVYSDQPPPNNANVEQIAAPPPPANPNAAKELATKQQELLQKKQQRADEETKAAKVRADADKKRADCGKLRGQLAALDAPVYLYRTNEKGEQILMDDAAKKKERDQINALMRENCSS